MKYLNEQKVKAIQSLCEIEGLKDGDIAVLFGVCRKTINNIRHGHRWSSVTGIQYKKELTFEEVLEHYEKEMELGHA